MEDIRNDIWADPDFEVLDGTAKLVYIWSWTNPRCDMAGLYTVSLRAIGVECGCDENAVEAAIERLTAARFISYVDGWLWVRTRVKHLRQKGAPMATSVVRDLDRLPAWHSLREDFVNEYAGELSKGRPWLQDALEEAGIRNPSGTPLDTQTPALESQKENPPGTPVGVAMDRDRVTDLTTSSQRKDEVDARTRKRGTNPVDQNVLPTSLPADLAPVAEETLAIVLATATSRGTGRFPTLRGIGLTIDQRRGVDHVAVARDLEHWALAGGGLDKTVRDWNGTYRTFHQRTPDAAKSSPPAAPQKSLNHLLKRS
jgi:hypothetical protein